MKRFRTHWMLPLVALPLGCSSHHERTSETRGAPQREASTERDADGDEDEGEEMEESAGKTSASGAAAPVLAGDQTTRSIDFAGTPVGSLPPGWRIEGTNQKGPLATWKVVADPSAPGEPNVLALTSPNHDSGSTFNLCWTDQVRFQDGAMEVSMKPVSGREDQGGGLIWRAKDKDDYYICRANPLESNFRVYYVKDASRHQLASASVAIETGAWHTIRVEQSGDRIACSLDGKRLLEVRDATIAGEGGIGLWTKSDAASEFARLQVTTPAAGGNR